MILLSKVGCSGIRAVAHRWRARMILQRRTGGPRVRMAPHLDAVLSSRARLVLLGSMAVLEDGCCRDLHTGTTSRY